MCHIINFQIPSAVILVSSFYGRTTIIIRELGHLTVIYLVLTGCGNLLFQIHNICHCFKGKEVFTMKIIYLCCKMGTYMAKKKSIWHYQLDKNISVTENSERPFPLKSLTFFFCKFIYI